MPSQTAPKPREHRQRRDEHGRVDIKSFTRDQLQDWAVETLGADRALGLRVFKELWQKGARSFSEMTDVSIRWHGLLDQHAFIAMLVPDLVLASEDGTLKYLWALEDGRQIESVLIPDGDRVTLCLSSQVGCAMACSFCLTGDLGLIRQLKPSEIANQAMQINRQYSAETGRRITNLVFMGMGEPLHNLPNLVPALKVCLDDHGLNYSHRRVTVSTVGLVHKMAELAAAVPVNLAVSVNASSEEQRLGIMPITKRHSLADLIQGMRDFPLPNGKRITAEYVMMGGFNDSLEDAARLHALLDDVRVKVNLIPYNENPDRDIRRPSDDTVKAFQHYLVSRGMNCSVRTTRGLDISAACGQLGKAAQQAKQMGWLHKARVVAGLEPDLSADLEGQGKGAAVADVHP